MIDADVFNGRLSKWHVLQFKVSFFMLHLLLLVRLFQFRGLLKQRLHCFLGSWKDLRYLGFQFFNNLRQFFR